MPELPHGLRPLSDPDYAASQLRHLSDRLRARIHDPEALPDVAMDVATILDGLAASPLERIVLHSIEELQSIASELRDAPNEEAETVVLIRLYKFAKRVQADVKTQFGVPADPAVSYDQAIEVARALVESGENREYTRGAVEVLADLFGYRGAADMDEAKERICADLGLPPTTLA